MPRAAQHGVDRWFTAGATVVAIVSLVFTLGFNWSKVSEHDRRLQDAEKQVAQIQANLAQQDKTQAVMTEKLDRIQQTVSTISGKLDGAAQARR